MFNRKQQGENAPQSTTQPDNAEESRRFTDTVGDMETVLSKGVEIKGDIKGSANVRVDGSVTGNFDISSTLFVSKAGKVEGEVVGRNVIVEGTIEGNVHGKDKVELRDGSRVTGNLEAKSIAISEGSFFQGNVKMNNTSSTEPVRFSEKRQTETGQSASTE